jgi:hypothetical protein
VPGFFAGRVSGAVSICCSINEVKTFSSSRNAWMSDFAYIPVFSSKYDSKVYILVTFIFIGTGFRSVDFPPTTALEGRPPEFWEPVLEVK